MLTDFHDHLRDSSVEDAEQGVYDEGRDDHEEEVACNDSSVQARSSRGTLIPANPTNDNRQQVSKDGGHDGRKHTGND